MERRKFYKCKMDIVGNFKILENRNKSKKKTGMIIIAFIFYYIPVSLTVKPIRMCHVPAEREDKSEYVSKKGLGVMRISEAPIFFKGKLP